MTTPAKSSRNWRTGRSGRRSSSGSAPIWICWPGWKSHRGCATRSISPGSFSKRCSRLTRECSSIRGPSGRLPEVAAWLRSILSHNLADVLRKLTAHKRDFRREWSLDRALDQSASRVEQWLAAEQSSPSRQAIRQEELLRMAEVARHAAGRSAPLDRAASLARPAAGRDRDRARHDQVGRRGVAPPRTQSAAKEPGTLKRG